MVNVGIAVDNLRSTHSLKYDLAQALVLRCVALNKSHNFGISLSTLQFIPYGQWW